MLGFNNNVRHKGRMFHIQTEDSGIRHPHIITHLFADGGRILKTTKTPYAEHVGTPTMAETVREMMKEQHKAMFIALREGHFDRLFDEGAAKSVDPAKGDASKADASKADAPKADAPPAPAEPARAAPAPEPPPPPAPPASIPTTTSFSSARVDGSSPSLSAGRAPGSPSATLAGPPPVPPRPTPPSLASEGDAVVPPAAATIEGVPPSRRTSSRPRIELDAAALHNLGPRVMQPLTPSARVSPPPHSSAVPAQTAPQEAQPSQRSPAASTPDQPAIDLDLDILERAAAEAQTGFQQQIQDLPPPPASVIGRRPGSSAGAYSAITPPTVEPPPPSVEPQRSSAGRYAPPRPASIFGTTRPNEGASIFGEDLISEKSLDEVILSYLAEDLDASPEKK
ncbi:Hypothetical protein CAP_4702 [Chondromyces apiculatus DSM 436]|uniref:Uncharacterized protein n=1 Tax=Chondromyces apiculatus DSM 436 TaxID=1192034 RepID=A0A017T607_9BACT|nr:Hypothetical protein CAP_4702 [Chondromyces apiculatus DSM 436]